MILACVMIMIAVSHVPCVSYDADWLAGCLAGLFGCLAGRLVGLCCIRKQDLSSADTSLYVKMIMLISITGWLASWLGWLAGRCGLAGWLGVCGCGLADWLWLAGWLAGWLAVAAWLVG